jgi:NAD dependent epimerase/dehydratase family enzyme
VLSEKGGMVEEFRKPIRLGLAPVMGSGKQMLSWIHIDDLCRVLLHALDHSAWEGVFNAVSPQPVDNKTLTLGLAKKLKGNYYVQVYVPSFLLKLIIGEMSVEILKSTTVSAAKLRAAGFQFLYPSIDVALASLPG